MKFIKLSTARKLLAIGLLSTTLPTLINDFIPVPDFFRGAMIGLGLSLEIISFVFFKRVNNFVCKNGRDETNIQYKRVN